eukprot:TRINITY_DN1160_c0_g3_i1.p1 TRINITY_DN1160_c0_g3~~TRINITY_DN1160_c0_g3_i1.p1  ORF type:complete len:344 (+),score=128.04 TRINITY_DN1160_c0_g3_i1:25-1056(+)
MAGSIQQSNLQLTDKRIENGGWNIGQLTVATKRLDPNQYSPNVPAIRAFLEKKITKIRLLHHPNLVTVLDMSYASDEVYIVREYVKGSDLSGYLTSSLSLNDRLLIAQQIASAMAFLHSQNILHHNLKPSNVLLADNSPKLTKVCDVGFWATATQKYNATKEDALWTAPEALSKKPFDADCDIFSFGLLLYCLVAKKSSPLERSAESNFKFTFNKDDNKDIPDDIWDIVVGCCDQTPSRRPKFSEIEKTLKTYQVSVGEKEKEKEKEKEEKEKEGKKKSKKKKEGEEKEEGKEKKKEEGKEKAKKVGGDEEVAKSSPKSLSSSRKKKEDKSKDSPSSSKKDKK